MNLNSIDPNNHSIFEPIPINEKYFLQIGDRWRYNGMTSGRFSGTSWSLVAKDSGIVGNNARYYGMGSEIILERLKEDYRKKIQEDEKYQYSVY